MSKPRNILCLGALSVLCWGAFAEKPDNRIDRSESVTKIKNSESGVFVLGECKSPCLIQLPKDTKFLIAEAIVEAGGATDRADLGRILLVSGSETMILKCDVVNSKDVMKRVQPGDIIVVLSQAQKNQ